MIVTSYLYVSSAGNVRSTKTKQSARANEIRIEVKLDIPDAFFKRPSPVVSIAIPPSESPVPIADIVASTAETVAQALRVEVDDVQDGLFEAIRRREEGEEGEEGES